jgi:hypothetical protein
MLPVALHFEAAGAVVADAVTTACVSLGTATLGPLGAGLGMAVAVPLGALLAAQATKLFEEESGVLGDVLFGDDPTALELFHDTQRLGSLLNVLNGASEAKELLSEGLALDAKLAPLDKSMAKAMADWKLNRAQPKFATSANYQNRARDAVKNYEAAMEKARPVMKDMQTKVGHGLNELLLGATTLLGGGEEGQGGKGGTAAGSGGEAAEVGEAAPAGSATDASGSAGEASPSDGQAASESAGSGTNRPSTTAGGSSGSGTSPSDASGTSGTGGGSSDASGTGATSTDASGTSGSSQPAISSCAACKTDANCAGFFKTVCHSCGRRPASCESACCQCPRCTTTSSP